MTIGPATAEHARAVADIWHAGWRESHLGRVPDELVAVRTPESFVTRAVQHVGAGDTIVALVNGSVAGFVMVVGDEVEQVYVAPQHRGSGVAAALLAAAEERVRTGGHERAWLAVVADNTRARRFYERAGWTDEGPFEHRAPGPAGPITVPARRYTKRVTH